MALSNKQRKAIHARDDTKCQFPHAKGDYCGGGGLQVHHILPQRWAENHEIPWQMIDRPENLLTICVYAHTTLIHPDIVYAKHQYGVNHDSFNDVFAGRDHLLDMNLPYWNQRFDQELVAIARIRTLFAKKMGWTFPDKR